MRALILAGFIVVSNLSYSADPVGRTHKTTAPTEARGEHGTVPLAIQTWLIENFGLSKEFIETQWGDKGDKGLSLPSALSRMAAGDYSQMAEIAAQLMGTANPAIVDKAFNSARLELLKRHDGAKKNADLKSESNFFESMLFGFWGWPEAEDEKKAFCSATVAAAEKTAGEANPKIPFDAANWKGDEGLTATYQVLIEGGKDVKADGGKFKDEEENNLKKTATKNCYDGTYGPYEKFKAAFGPAADKVWKWNQEYHSKAGEITKDGASNAEKAAAFKAISERVSGKNLATFAVQQMNSGFIDKKDNQISGKNSANLAFRIMSAVQADFQDGVRKVKFENSVGPLGDFTWTKDQKPADEFEKLDFVKKANESKTLPWFWPEKYKEVKPPTPALTQPQPQPAGQPQQPASGATNPPNEQAKQAIEAFKQNKDAIMTSCNGCHSTQKKDLIFSDLSSLTKESAKYAIENMLNKTTKDAKSGTDVPAFTEAQKKVFIDWAKAKGFTP
jgi:cytochrome c553